MDENSNKKSELLPNERRQKILELIQEDGSARVKNLSALFKVTEPTIRQDLEKLEIDGFVIREHGGAYLRSLSNQVSSLTLQHTDHIFEKNRIAKIAASHVNNGDSIILDSGSTITELAKVLVSKNELTVITNALNIALLLGVNPVCHLLLTGGEFKPPTLSLTGEKAALMLNNVYVDKLFLATGGISPNFDLTYPSFSDISVKKAMIDAARVTYLLADSSKFGKGSLASLGNLSMVDYLITDKLLSDDHRKAIEGFGVEILLA